MLELGDEDGELGEDVGLDVVAEELGGGRAEAVDGEAAVDGDHVTADVVLGDGALLVAGVALLDPGDLVEGDELGVDGPVHEGGAASPDQSVPSQSNTAIWGLRAWTRAWNSGVVSGVGLSDKGAPCLVYLRIVDLIFSVRPSARNEEGGR